MPMQGYKEEKNKGLFIGFSKGLIGVIVKPFAAIFDFISLNAETVKRLLSLRDEPTSLRITRFPYKDNILRSYCFSKAKGFRILQ